MEFEENGVTRADTGAPPAAVQTPAPAYEQSAAYRQETPESGGPAQPTERKKKKKQKKEKTPKQQLVSIGVLIVVLSFFLSLIAGAGGAFLLLRFYPDAVPKTEDPTAEISNGVVHELPTGRLLPDVSEDATEAPAVPQKTKGDIYAEAVDSIVGISAVRKTEARGYFGMPVTQTVTSTGSGFFVRSNGYIVTNYHVVEEAESITVSTFDGSTYPATVRGYEEANDIAVLKIDGSYKSAVIGSSASLRVGDDIMVIGNPLGSLSYTFTDGVVSYRSRNVKNENGVTINMFQTNAAINEGNSGGPVYNMQGQVVGIASAKYSSSSVEGLGFCIPIDDVIGKIDDIIVRGYVSGKPVMGVSLQTITEYMSYYYALPVGCYVVAVGEGTAAAKAGVKEGDVIVAVDDTVIGSIADMSSVLSRRSAGDTVSVTLNRNASELTVRVTLDEYKPADPRTQYSNVYDY